MTQHNEDYPWSECPVIGCDKGPWETAQTRNQHLSIVHGLSKVILKKLHINRTEPVMAPIDADAVLAQAAELETPCLQCGDACYGSHSLGVHIGRAHKSLSLAERRQLVEDSLNAANAEEEPEADDMHECPVPGCAEAFKGWLGVGTHMGYAHTDIDKPSRQLMIANAKVDRPSAALERAQEATPAFVEPPSAKEHVNGDAQYAPLNRHPVALASAALIFPHGVPVHLVDDAKDFLDHAEMLNAAVQG